MQHELILVDDMDNVVGYGEKLQVHQEGKLHRAFSIFVVNDNHELLLQRRALSKYHSAGLWANTCCSHPLKGMDISQTVHHRLKEEMGFDCILSPLFSFIYRAEFENGLTEYEYDHVYIGYYNESPKPNPAEVCDWQWMDVEKLKKDLEINPDKYVYWLREAFGKFYDHYLDKINQQ